MIVTVSWPHKYLSPNARAHWRRVAPIRAAYRNEGFWEAAKAGARDFDVEQLRVIITFYPPDNRRRDRDNMIASVKNAADGIADRIGVDDHKWRPTYQVAKCDGRGRVEFYFPEFAALPVRGVVR